MSAPRKAHCVHGHEYAVVGRVFNGLDASGCKLWKCAECVRENSRRYRATAGEPYRARKREQSRLDRALFKAVFGVTYKPKVTV